MEPHGPAAGLCQAVGRGRPSLGLIADPQRRCRARRLRREHARRAAPPRRPSQVQSAFQGSPPPLAALHAQANHLLAGGAPRLPRPAGRAARLSGGGQQVGVVVRAVPERVPGLPEGRGRARAARSPSSASTPRTPPASRPRLPASLPGHLPELHRSREAASPCAFGASTYYPQTLFFSRTGTAATCSTMPGPTRAPPR